MNIKIRIIFLQIKISFNANFYEDYIRKKLTFSFLSSFAAACDCFQPAHSKPLLIPFSFFCLIFSFYTPIPFSIPFSHSHLPLFHLPSTPQDWGKPPFGSLHSLTYQVEAGSSLSSLYQG